MYIPLGIHGHWEYETTSKIYNVTTIEKEHLKIKNLLENSNE